MKLSKIKAISTNLESGAWVKTNPHLDIPLKVRGMNNSDARKLRLKLVQEYRDRIDDKAADIPEDVVTEINCAVLAQTILTDWGLEDDAGQKIPYDPDLAKTYLAELEVLREAASYCSQVVGTAGQASLDAAVKN